MMTKLQSFLQRACNELGLTVVAPVVLTVRENIRINAQALLPQLGAPKGMIIVNNFDELRGVASELQGIGYGYCVLGQPSPLEEFDLESHIEMFCDWGWGKGNEIKPDWMNGFPAP